METFCFAVFVAAEPCVCRRHREISRHIFGYKAGYFWDDVGVCGNRSSVWITQLWLSELMYSNQCWYADSDDGRSDRHPLKPSVTEATESDLIPNSGRLNGLCGDTETPERTLLTAASGSRPWVLTWQVQKGPAPVCLQAQWAHRPLLSAARQDAPPHQHDTRQWTESLFYQIICQVPYLDFTNQIPRINVS